MRSGSVILLCLLTACGSVPFAGTEKGDVWNGVFTRLALLDPNPTVGRPIRLRLEMTNAGISTVVYDDQSADINRSLDVRGPDGRKIRYIGGWELGLYPMEDRPLEVNLVPPEPSLGDPRRIVLRFGTVPGPDEERLGSSEWGPVAIRKETPAMARAWPGYRDAIAAALGLRVP